MTMMLLTLKFIYAAAKGLNPLFLSRFQVVKPMQGITNRALKLETSYRFRTRVELEATYDDFCRHLRNGQELYCTFQAVHRLAGLQTAVALGEKGEYRLPPKELWAVL